MEKKSLAAVLKDCAMVYSTRIGEVSAARLKELGLEAVVYSGPSATWATENLYSPLRLWTAG